MEELKKAPISKKAVTFFSVGHIIVAIGLFASELVRPFKRAMCFCVDILHII